MNADASNIFQLHCQEAKRQRGDYTVIDDLEALSSHLSIYMRMSGFAFAPLTTDTLRFGYRRDQNNSRRLQSPEWDCPSGSLNSAPSLR